MNLSDRFSSQVLKIEKKNRNLGEKESTEALKQTFFSHIKSLPEELKYDFFEYFYDQFEREENPKYGFYEFSSKLRSIIELFNFEFDPKEDNYIMNEDWDFIKETVSDYALDLDDQTLTYIMRFVVEKGRFDE